MRILRFTAALLPALALISACGSDDPPVPVTQAAPKITSAPVTSAKVGTPYSYTIVATGNPSATIAVTRGPTWLNLAGRVLSGTPTAGDVGMQEVSITATNGIDPDAVQSFTITVAPGDVSETAPMITSTAPLTSVVGVEYAYTIVATGNPAATISASGDGAALPGWLSFNTETARLSGTPMPGDIGAHAIVVVATNGVNPDARQAFTITVSATGVAPAFTSTPITDADEGVEYSYTVAASGTPAPTIAATTIPTWLTYAGGVLSGTPGAADVGMHAVELTATNGIDPAATQSFMVTVAASPGTAPQFTSTPVTMAQEGVLYTYTATATGDPSPTLSAMTLPSWLVFDVGTGLLSGTPMTADVGAHVVALSATNGITPAGLQMFTIDVAGTPVAPTITSTAVITATEGQAYSYTIVAAGTPAPTVTVTADGGGALPAWLTYDAGTGVLSGTPGAADVGALTVVVTAANGALPDARQVFTIAVSPAIAPPTITSVAPTTAQVGALYTYVITVNAAPTATITVAGLPGWLTFDGVATISGTPGEGDIGVTGTATVTADNGLPPAAIQSFTITVSPMPAIAVLGAPYAQDFEGTAPGWVAGGQWAFGEATIGASTVGPPSLYDGSLAATNLTANYANSANWTLRTPVFDFTGVTAPRLRFAHWYNFERATSGTPPSNYDGGNIKISTDGGMTWVEIDGASVTPPYVGVLVSGNTMPGQSAWSGILADWQIATIDLGPALAGMPLDQVVLRFDFGSDTSVPRPGWYVDAVRVGDANDLSVAPTITSVLPDLNVVAGNPWSYTVTTTGMPTPTLTATGAAGALPGWLTFDPVTGVLSGTPSNADGGANGVVIRASNGEPRDAVQAFSINVIPLQTLASYIFDGDVRTATVTGTGVTLSDFDNRASNTTFVAGNPGRAVNSNGFVDAVDPNYYQFTITPAVGMQVRLTEFSFDHYRSSTGPTSFVVSTVAGGVVTPLTGGARGVPTPTTWTTETIAFAGAEGGPYGVPVTIRIAASGASSSAGTFRLDNISIAGLVEPRELSAPVISGTPGTMAAAGVAYSYTFAVDGWTAPTVTVTGLPSWLTYTAATRTIAGTPSALNVGTTGPITIAAANGILPNATQMFSIAVTAPPPVVVNNGTPVIQGFGAALPAGWGASGGWAFGIPTTGANTVGPPSVLDGEVAATVLSGNYSSSALWSLATASYDLTTVTNPLLQFTHWHNFERATSGTPPSNYDGGNLKISTDGGATWSELLPTSVSPAYTGNLVVGNTMPGQAAWSGILADWTLVTVDLGATLAAAPRGQVVIRFDLGSDTSVARPGWYLDNVRIGAAADLAVAPVFTSAPDRSAREAVAFSHTVAATGAPAPTFTATAMGGGALPAWLTFNPATRVLSGTPGAGDVGAFAVAVTAINAGGMATQTLNVRVFGAAATPTYVDNFDGAAMPWVIGFEVGLASDWQIGTPSLVGPTACNSGTMCAGTNLAANYTEEDRLSYIQTPVLDLSGLPQPALRFRQWYRTESGFDGGNVKLSTDGGATFTQVTASSVVPAYTSAISTSFGNPLAGQLTWNGTGTTWTLVNVNLAADLAGLPRDQIVVRFEFGTDDDTVFAGWYLDDVSIGDIVTLP